ncbi:hypothetical protein B0H13DRAFT_1076408 [Mycena leptocephala]|nr:hypothetical protein B0H13DRAFT_1076408 [Mycena leptocephala]
MRLPWHWYWLLDFFSFFSRFPRNNRQRLRPSPGQLNDDLLLEIFSRQEISFEDTKEISLGSRRFRALLMPTLFGKHVWSPWRGARRAFPPESLWPHIRVLTLVGPAGDLDQLIESERREFLVSHLRLAIHRMISVHTIVFSRIHGGLWPEILDSVADASGLSNLVLEDSPWLGLSRDIFHLPSIVSLPPLLKLEYISPHAVESDGRISTTVARPFPRLECEVKNLRSILRACHSNLEVLTLPAELSSLALDSSLRCNSLRELYLEGYWPEHPGASLLSALLILSHLRVASLRCHPSVPSHTPPIFPEDMSLASVTDKFLPELRQFEVASLAPGDRILSILPPALDKLCITEYPPPYGSQRFPTNTLRASRLLRMLAGVYLPAITELEIWYITDASDTPLLRCLPRVFPSLRHLEIHRFMGTNVDHEWNPGPVFQNLLPEFKSLRLFALEPDDPYRRQITPRGIEYKNAKYIRRLRSLADEMVRLTPWLREIRISIQCEDLMYWEAWEVVSVPGEEAYVRLRYPPGSFIPEIQAILDGPLEDAESEPESD